jgi:hypothetical protein
VVAYGEGERREGYIKGGMKGEGEEGGREGGGGRVEREREVVGWRGRKGDLEGEGGGKERG